MFKYLANLRGIPAIVIIAGLGALALVFDGVALVRRLAWTLAALFAVLVALHEWRRR